MCYLDENILIKIKRIYHSCKTISYLVLEMKLLLEEKR
jgi:hypothetical protein